MDLHAKKIYCTGCKKLVRSHRQKGGGTLSILCNSCGKTLYAWDGVTWKYLGASA